MTGGGHGGGGDDERGTAEDWEALRAAWPPRAVVEADPHAEPTRQDWEFAKALHRRAGDLEPAWRDAGLPEDADAIARAAYLKSRKVERAIDRWGKLQGLLGVSRRLAHDVRLDLLMSTTIEDFLDLTGGVPRVDLRRASPAQRGALKKIKARTLMSAEGDVIGSEVEIELPDPIGVLKHYAHRHKLVDRETNSVTVVNIGGNVRPYIGPPTTGPAMEGDDGDDGDDDV